MSSSSSQNFLHDFRVYEATPGLGVVVKPDFPLYTIAAVSNDFVVETGLTKNDIIGWSCFEVLSGGDGSDNQTLTNSLKEVITTKAPQEVLEYKSTIRTHARSWRVKSTPVLDDSGEILCIVLSFNSSAEQSINSKISQSGTDITKAYKFFMDAPVIIGYVKGNDYIVEFANEGLLQVWGQTKEVIGKSLLKAIPELEQQGIRQLLDGVRQTGKPFYAYEYPLVFDRDGKEETLYFDFVYQPFYENGDEIMASGVISVGHNVTEQVRVREKFKSLIEQANNPIYILKGKDMVLEVANDALYKAWNIDKSAIGKTFPEIFPESKHQVFLEIFQRVYRTGESFQGFEMPALFEHSNGRKDTLYFNFTCQPYRELDGKISGVLVLASEATAQVKARKDAEESQMRWKQLANSMPAMVWTAEPDGSINFLNDRCYQFTGMTEKESKGFTWSQLVHPDDRENYLQIWANARRNELLYQVEARYRNKDGNYRWMMMRGVPVKHDGKVSSWYGTNVDIHDQKQLELHLEDKVSERTRELQEKNILLDNILIHSSNGISVSEMILDSSGKVVDALTIMANDAAINFTGLPRDIYLTKRATEMDPNILSSPYGQTCIETLTTGKPSIIQYFLEFSSKWLELTISRMDETHLIHIFTDVTPIRQTQLQLEKSLEELRYANANLEEFAYAASHDLKEPVRKIQFFSNRLKEELKNSLDASQRDLFERLEKSSNRMQRLIDDLLEYSQAAKGSSEKEEINLDIKVKNVLEDLELEIQRRQANIIVDPLPTIMGNQRQIHQLFQNLLSNALKYSRPELQPEVRISSKVTKGKHVRKDLPPEAAENLYHLIEVSDNGIGFDQKEAEVIFKVFVRLHSANQYRGSGIGLSIVRKVVESHNGYVWTESEPGKGSTFFILLPKGD